MGAAETDSSGTGLGSIVVGLFSVVGAVAVVASVFLSVIEYWQIAGGAVTDIIAESPLSYVGVPGVVLVVWLLVGSVLLVGRSWSVHVGAAAYLGAVLVNLVVIATQVLEVRPLFLWYVDPVTPLVSIPVQLLGVAGLSPLTFQTYFYLTGGIGTLGSLLLGGYLGVRAVQTVVR